MKIRYIGPEDEVWLSIPGASLVCPRGKWLDAEATAEEAGVPGSHMDVVVRGLVDHPYWEVQGVALARPADSAGKKAWVAYAVGLGWTADDAGALTKGDLVTAIDAAPPSDPAPDDITDTAPPSDPAADITTDAGDSPADDQEQTT